MTLIELRLNRCQFVLSVSLNIMAESTYMTTTKAHITYLCRVKVKFTVKDKKNKLNHLHGGKRGQI